MTQQSTYATPVAFRTALEHRINSEAASRGIDVTRLRRQAAFDRFLTRLFSDHNQRFVLKGGYALELALPLTRVTKDIDVALRLERSKRPLDEDGLRGVLQSRAEKNTGDYFEYSVGPASLDLDNAPYGGFRFPVTANMAGREFSRFSVDIATGETWFEPHCVHRTHDWFGFAGIAPAEVFCICLEQQFAEKLHALTRPRLTQNSRVKDLVDIILLIRNGSIETDRLIRVAHNIFNKRATHSLPVILPKPPALWSAPFETLASECGLNIDIHNAFAEAVRYCQQHGLSL